MTRSRSIVLSILLLTITAAASAQSSTSAQTPTAVAAAPTEPIHFGVLAGTNAFKTSGQSFDNKTKFGFTGGVYADIGIHRKWGIQPELLYNLVVARTSDQFNNIYPGIGASNQNVMLNYVTLPILITFKATDAFTILAGPQYGYLIYQTQGISKSPPGPNEAFNKNDFSILFGGHLKVGRMGLGLRYVIGFIQLNHIDDNLDSWKNRGFQLYLTYRIK